MKRVEMKIDFKSSVEEVFKIVSNMDDCSWRSDLSKVKKVDNHTYLEYDRKHHVTNINITNCRKNIQFEYDIQNNNYKGHWSGQFAPLKNGGCRIYLVFYFEPCSILGKFINVDKFEERYIEDLRKKLREYE